MKTFQELGLSRPIQQALDELGFSEPTPIQQKSIPVLKDGHDVIGQAQTGTGKTAAFGIPVAENMTPIKRPQSIILTPTRELAIQVANELKKITKYKNIKIAAIYGGQPIFPQINELKQGAQVIVGTPGRILDHLQRKTLKTEEIKTVILDEADEMLDMGFIQDIEAILNQMPKERQTMLFSATLQKDIKQLAYRYMHKPVIISVTKGNETAATIEQVFYRTFEQHKLEAISRIIDSENIEVAIIFCKTKKGVSTLVDALNSKGYRAEGLHGDLTQPQRLNVMNGFRKKRINLLVATDIAARGIDVAHVTHVINYDIPEDPEQYVHRIGRTGRAGKSGMAFTFVTPQDGKFLHAIEEKINSKIPEAKLPDGNELIMRKFNRLKEEIANSGNSNQEVFQSLSEQLLTSYSPKEAISSLLAMLLSVNTLQIPEEYQFGETGGEKGMVRFFLNVGRNVDLHPKKLVDEISTLASISKRDIGRIDIFERFSFFEISLSVAPYVYECLKQEGLNGSRIHLEPAKPPQRSLQTAR
ncbi:RNA helicase [Pueribacillus theae]|uniref:ATP-dependent RNA helicase CshA n=1 Tax=Pueribacillus theae TaxID=2171751 RepID=A0A2U1K8C8_9BACI|nr:DEAD/DEAH box helicase [Pueribacillus theae]PWA13569.1 RNA helicase [Pueribacillus theae]